MSAPLISVKGILVKGYGVASGPSADYPYGALERQIPRFEARGLDLTQYFRGTLNVDIRPLIFEFIRPDFTFQDVRWTDLHPPETFSFLRCAVMHCDIEYAGWIYYPHPETKRRNFQDPSLLEVISSQIPGTKHGDSLEVFVNPAKMRISPAR